MSNRYNAEIVAGGLLATESRILAALLLANTSADELRHLLVVDNVLQKRSRSTATRMAGLISKRLGFADRGLLNLIANGDQAESRQALLFTAIKHSNLIGDYLIRVVKGRWRRYEPKIRASDWDEFLRECEQLDPSVTMWKPTTRAKLGQVVRKSLWEAGYLDSTRDSNIIPVHLTPTVRDYLNKPGNEYVLDAMDILS